jgi:hypothetical protein
VEGLQNGREQRAAARQSKQEVKNLLLINRVGSKKKYKNSNTLHIESCTGILSQKIQ